MKLSRFIVILVSIVVSYSLLETFFPEYRDFVIAVVVPLAIFGELGVLYLMRKRSSGKLEIKNEKKVEDLSAYEGIEFHNDFSKVPAGEKSEVAPKPINFATTNIYNENYYTLQEDLKNAGLELEEKDDSKKGKDVSRD